MMTVADSPLRSSLVSECARYRYLLTEQWGTGDRTIAWVMLHPPLNDEIAERTAMHLGEFSRRWGYDRLAIVNLFAGRAVQPEALSDLDDPVGPENRWYLRQAVTESELVIVGWGDGLGRVGPRPKTLDDLVELRRANAAMLCFGLTEAGNPVHPGIIADSAIPVVWTAP
jgi:hypothetical protein